MARPSSGLDDSMWSDQNQQKARALNVQDSNRISTIKTMNNAGLPPHLRGKAATQIPSSKITSKTSALHQLPHMRCSIKKEDAATDTATAVAKSIPPHMVRTPIPKTIPSATTGLPNGKTQERALDQTPVSSTEGVKVKDESLSTKNSNGAWGAESPLDPELAMAMVAEEMKALAQICNDAVVPLTEEAITKATGSTPRKGKKTFDVNGLVSTSGVSQVSSDRPREGVRATQGRPAAEELLDWDGSMMPPPEDWDEDRPGCNTVYVSQWLPEWIKAVAEFPDRVLDIKAPEFKQSLPAAGDQFLQPIAQPDSKPDVPYSIDERRRLNETSESVSKEFRVKQQKKKVVKQATRQDQEARYREIEEMANNPAPNSFAPTMEVYLRPATIRDAAGIAEIYNYYVETTNIPEDQARISPKEAEYMVIAAQNEQLPFVVAIKGRKPASHDKQGRPGTSEKANMPQFESVVGFSAAETFNYSYTGARNGRSRTTANLQLYVHPEHRRKGIARNLLDRMMHILNPGYGFDNACDWANPGKSKFHETGGAGSWHQLIFQLAISGKHDPHYEMVKTFLRNKFMFSEQGCLRGAARSSTRLGPAKWLDLVFFQAEAGEDFDPYA